MPTLHRLPTLAVLIVAGGFIAFALPAHAAESYDNCTGFIDSLPATIGSQGTWCLRKDLSTGMSSGQAILVATNNVTLDCNDFKIGGLSAGVATEAVGIRAQARQNISVRNCSVRGFNYGVSLAGDNHSVVDSRFDLNTLVGIYMSGDGNEARSNVVSATGGQPLTGFALGIVLAGPGARVLDNRVHGVSAMPDAGGLNRLAGGIQADGGSGAIVGNVVTGIDSAGTAHGIRVYQGIVRDNVVVQTTDNEGSTAIVCLDDGSGSTTGLSDDNSIRSYANAHLNCAVSSAAVEP